MGMKYVAAYLMAALGGKESPSADDIKAILESVESEYVHGELDHLRGHQHCQMIQWRHFYIQHQGHWFRCLWSFPP